MRILVLTALAAAAGATAAPAASAAADRLDGRCRVPADARDKLRTPSVVLYRQSRDTPDGESSRYSGCLTSLGRRVTLTSVADEFDSGSGVTRLVAKGRFAGLAVVTGGRGAATIALASVDLRTGRQRRSVRVDGEPFMPDELLGFAVSTSGDLAWSLNRSVQDATASPRYVCEVHALDARGDVVLDTGAPRAFPEVRTYGRSLAWSAPGGRRRASAFAEPG